MLTRRAATKVLARDQHAGTAILRPVQDEVARAAPIVKQKRSVARALDPLQELLGDDLVGIDVGPIERSEHARDAGERFHQLNRRTSTR